MLEHLFKSNENWAKNILKDDPEFFQKLLKQQQPDYFWIGCSDSRVPATEIVDLLPGEIFVQRNVANLVVHSDLNCLSSLQFAVDILKVKHVIVCGHYGCGGIRATLDGQRHGLIDNWLRHVNDVIKKHKTTLMDIKNKTARIDKLCELNVIEQVVNVCETTIVQDAWARGQDTTVHGLIYALHDGHLRDLGICIGNADSIMDHYQQSLDKVLQ